MTGLLEGRSSRWLQRLVFSFTGDRSVVGSCTCYEDTWRALVEKKKMSDEMLIYLYPLPSQKKQCELPSRSIVLRYRAMVCRHEDI
jgi:hypothetical protein